MSHSAALPPPSFPIRRMDFAFEQKERYWLDGDVFMTSFANVLSALFPPGERFFMDSLKAVRGRVEEPAMLSDIRSFLGQEAMHTKGHNALNAHIEKSGVDILTIERRTYGIMRAVRRVFPTPMQQLAITCAIEHFTATLSSHLLARKDIQEGFADPEVLHLWLWHAVEEVEHKALSIDVYRRLGGGEARRLSLMAVTAVVMGAVMTLWQGLLLHQERKLFSPSSWGFGLKKLLGRKGFITRMIPDLLAYMRPGFHPNELPHQALLEEARIRLAL